MQFATRNVYAAEQICFVIFAQKATRVS